MKFVLSLCLMYLLRLKGLEAFVVTNPAAMMTEVLAINTQLAPALLRDSMDKDTILQSPLTTDHVVLVPSQTLSAVTVDPTTILNDVFSGVLGTPVILAIPILAALSVASLIAFFIVSYANPAEPDD